MKYKKTHFYKKTHGFSLIELVVSMGIFVLVSGIILANYGLFSSNAVLSNLAHEIALSVRKAQVYGIAVQEFGSGSDIFPSYGINFEASNNKSFIIFADTNADGKYNGAELLESSSLTKGNIISQICGYTSSSASCTNLNTLNITFTRPDPEASIIGDPDFGQYAYSKITIQAPKGGTRDIVIWASGQISVQ